MKTKVDLVLYIGPLRSNKIEYDHSKTRSRSYKLTLYKTPK